MKKEKKAGKKQKLLKEKTKKATLEFQKEFKKSVVGAIISAFSLIIALTWRDVITALVTKISSEAPIKNSLISALIITTISVIGILIVSKIGKEKDEK